MDLREHIQKWLETDGNYTDGIALYEAASGKVLNLVRSFKRIQNPFHEKKLKLELERVLPLQKSPKIEFTTIQPQNQVDTNLSEDRYDHVPPSQRGKRIGEQYETAPLQEETKVEPFAIVEIKRLRNNAYRERDYLHGQLEHYATNDERYKAAQRMLELDDKIKAYWHELDKYKLTGYVPALPDETKLKKEIVTKFQRKKNLQAAISQRKSWIKKENLRTDTDQAKIQRWEDQKIGFKKELEALNVYLELD